MIHAILSASSSGDPIIDWLSRGGAIGTLAAGLVSFMRGWIYPSSTVNRLADEILQLRAERDKALDLVYKQAEISSRALELSERWSHL